MERELFKIIIFIKAHLFTFNFVFLRMEGRINIAHKTGAYDKIIIFTLFQFKNY